MIYFYVVVSYKMPYATRKVRNKSCYRVYNRRTKRVFAKCATKQRANKQMRLLRAIQYNPTFREKLKLNKR
jgi:hypothetical protein